MDEKEKEEKIKDMIEQFEKHSKTCMKEVLDVFQSKEVPIPVAYYILTTLVGKMEQVDPKLKTSRVVANMMTNMIMDRIKKKKNDVPEVRMVALARQMNKNWLKGKKASIWACGMKKTRDDIKTKCEECGGICYRSRDPDKDMLKKKAKKICLKCVVSNPKYGKDLNEEQRDLMEEGIK